MDQFTRRVQQRIEAGGESVELRRSQLHVFGHEPDELIGTLDEDRPSRRPAAAVKRHEGEFAARLLLALGRVCPALLRGRQFLPHGGDVASQSLAHRLCLMAHHDHELLWRQRRGDIEDVGEQRPASEGMQDFRKRGTHARALASREDNNCQRGN